MEKNKCAGRPRGVSSAKVIEVIEVEVTRGKGTEEDMSRFVKQYWSLEGEMLAEFDPLLE